MFLTRQLWNALRFPQWRHPIFAYARKQRPKTDSPSRMWRFLQLLSFASIIMFAIIFPIPVLMTSLGLILVIPLIMIILNGTVLGTIWVTGITSTLASTHANKHVDLLSLSPYGTLGTSWLLTIGVVYRRNWLRVIYRIVRWVVIVALVLLGIAITMLIIGVISSNSEQLQQQQVNVLRDVINISVIVFALWLDHVQSIVVAVLVGMLLPSIIKDQIQLRGIAPIIYITIQIISYLAIFLAYYLIQIILTGIFGNTVIISIIVAALTLLSFFLMRESIIALLWRLILAKYDATVDEYQKAIHV